MLVPGFGPRQDVDINLHEDFRPDVVAFIIEVNQLVVQLRLVPPPLHDFPVALHRPAASADGCLVLFSVHGLPLFVRPLPKTVHELFDSAVYQSRKG